MNKKKKLDERELVEMYKIEHYAFWIIFFILVLSIFVQIIFCNASFKQIGGEWVTLMIASLASSIAYYKGGHYDYFTKPGIKSYLLYSIIFTIIFEVVIAIAFYVHHNYYDITGFVIKVVIYGVILFFVFFASLALIGEAVKKRRRKLEEQFDENDNHKE